MTLCCNSNNNCYDIHYAIRCINRFKFCILRQSLHNYDTRSHLYFTLLNTFQKLAETETCRRLITCLYIIVFDDSAFVDIYIYTGCPRRKGPNFGRVFLRSNYNDITQNTYIQSSMDTEILAREVWNFDSYYSLIDYQIHIETGRNMWFL